MNNLGIDIIDENNKIKTNTINKDNRTIRTKQLYSRGKEAKILNNFLYRELQLKIEFDKTTEIGLKYKTLRQYDTELTIPKMKKILGLENNGKYIDLIETAIEELEKPIEIYNYIDKDGNLFKKQRMPSIVYSGRKQERENGEISYVLGISEHLYHIIKETKNNPFTQLDLDIHKKLTSNGIELYEWLKSYQNMGKGKTKGYCPPLNLEILNDMFFANYKYLSKVRVVLINSIKQINDKTDLVIREVIKENGKKGDIYLQVQENNKHKSKRLDKEISISKQKLGMEKQSYKLEKTETEQKEQDRVINSLMGKL